MVRNPNTGKMEAGGSGIQGQPGYESLSQREKYTKSKKKKKKTATIVRLHATCGRLPGSIALSDCELTTHRGRHTVFIRPFVEEACLPCAQEVQN